MTTLGETARFGLGSLPFVAILTFALYIAGVLVPTRQEIEEEGRCLGVLRLFMLFVLSFVLVNATVFLVQKYRGGTPSTVLR